MSARLTASIAYMNAEFIPLKELNFSYDNRSMQYGDGIFESIRFHQGVPLFVEDHMERLLAGMYALGFDFPLFDPVQLYHSMVKLGELNAITEGRLRLQVVRNTGGLYKPSVDSCSLFMTLESLDESLYSINDKGLRLGLFSEIRKPVNALSGIKSTSALLYVLGAREARQQNCDDALMLNEFGRICEATSGNLFLLMADGKVLTPSVSEGILPGVFRKRLIAKLREIGVEVEEGQVMHDDLYKASEVWLTNAIRGLRWVISWKERRYFGTQARRVAELLRAEAAHYIGPAEKHSNA
jgi:branched-chain amino acid aminotransferase